MLFSHSFIDSFKEERKNVFKRFKEIERDIQIAEQGSKSQKRERE